MDFGQLSLRIHEDAERRRVRTGAVATGSSRKLRIDRVAAAPRSDTAMRANVGVDAAAGSKADAAAGSKAPSRRPRPTIYSTAVSLDCVDAKREQGKISRPQQ